MPPKRIKETARKKPVKHHTKAVTVIKRSDTTGRAVWLYQGTSKQAARKAYERVRRKETSRIRSWKNRMKRREKAILAFLEKLVDALPMMVGMTQEQRQAVRNIQKIADNPPPCDTDLYNQARREWRKWKKRKEEAQRRREQQQETVADGTGSTDEKIPYKLNYDK